MEEVVRVRLNIIRDSVVSSVDSAKKIIENSEKRWTVDEVQISLAKLRALKDQLVSEMYKYYEVVKEPSSEEIAEHTVLQLKAEEVLAELSVMAGNLKQKSTVLSEGINIASKLPRMELTKFSGDVLKWYEFWDQFCSNVHERNINDVDKLLYLRSILDGEAKKTIEGLETTGLNYTIAIETLKERYGKPGAIVDAHYVALYRIKAASNCIKTCRDVLNEIERHLRVLKSLGEDVNHNHLRVMIIEKFPEDLIYELKMRMISEDESIDNIRKHLEHIISARESSSRIRRTTEDKENFTLETLHVQSQNSFPPFRTDNRKKYEIKSYKHKTSNPRKRPYKSNSEMRHGPDFKRRAKNCIFCNKDHFNDECTEVKSIQDRRNLLRDRCFVCLRKGHRTRECGNKRTCRHCGKYGEHNRALCPKRKPITPNPTESMYININRREIMLQTAVVKIYKEGSKSKLLSCRVLLDCGSQRSYITSTLMKQLDLQRLEENRLAIFTFGAESPKEIDSPMVRFNIITRTNKTKVVYANVVPHITHRVQCSTEILSTIRHSRLGDNKVMADDGSKGDQIDILIGNDYYNDFILNEKLEIDDGLFLINSVFGWICWGRCDNSERNRDRLSILTYFQGARGDDSNFDTPDLPLQNDDLKALWELEAIGITDSPKGTRDEEAVKQYNETIKFENDRYSVKWPWKEYPPTLTVNYGLAAGRLSNLIKRLNPDVLNMYNKLLKEQLESGIIEMVKDTNFSLLKHPIHYLPHHCVMPGGNPDKLRIVYDASAKIKGNHSLNECLYRGPLLLEDLTALLIKFREHPIGVISDVEKAFLQIGLQNEDRDVTRFLWIKDINREVSPENIVQFRFCRVPFGIISSPFLLNATIRYHLRRSNLVLMKQVSEDIYVDNLVTGTNTVSKAISLYKVCKTSFNELSMNLRAWNSNSKEFMSEVPEEFRAKNLDVVKVLGMMWKLRDDHLQLNYQHSEDKIKNAHTKREVLQFIASIYDPCGFGAPIILPAKKFLQELWKEKIKWDVPLTDKALREWQLMAGNFQQMTSIQIPRFYARRAANLEEFDLHCFTDASKQAYAAVVYMRGTCPEGIFSSFIIGKSRLVPIKNQDELQIPRLELLGAVIGNRLLQHVQRILRHQVQRCFLWTDSQVVLNWCKSEKLLPPFVERRVNEIKGNKNLQLRYVPSGINPADIGTRTNGKINGSDWLAGPDFLISDQDKWPVNNINCNYESHANVLSSEEMPARESHAIREKPLSETQGPEKEQEIETIKELQLQHFPKEIANIKTDIARSLRLFKDERGLLRCEGRYRNARCPQEQRYPILLPKNTEFTFKTIEAIHTKNYHVGVSHTLALVRMNYWIQQGRSQVQRVIRKCKQCKKYGGGPYKLPQMAPLPHERINYHRAFQFIGLDYFGPLMIKNGSLEKRWVCLFTCLAVRAIHMEVVKDLSAEECLLAIRRFVATRGVPHLVISDNALQFKLTADVLTNDYCIENQIRWKFIPELAPWFGGLYERLIGLVKHCMKRTIDKHLLSNNQLSTIIKEIEAVVNTRPLTTVGTDLEHIISPADFLHAGGPLLMEITENEFVQPATVTKTTLIEGWKRGQTILKEFVNMFVNQYLSGLRNQRTIHKQPRIVVDAVPQIGDIVQLKGDHNRTQWKVGRITEVVKGSDGLIRVAKVTLPSGEVFTRSIAHLYPLEINECEDRDKGGPGTAAGGSATNLKQSEGARSGEAMNSMQRPTRSSAQKARERVKEWTKQLIHLVTET